MGSSPAAVFNSSLLLYFFFVILIKIFDVFFVSLFIICTYKAGQVHGCIYKSVTVTTVALPRSSFLVLRRFNNRVPFYPLGTYKTLKNINTLNYHNHFCNYTYLVSIYKIFLLRPLQTSFYTLFHYN